MISNRPRAIQRLYLITILLSGFAGAGAASAAPKISVEPSKLNFYEVGIGSPAISYFQVVNLGKTQLVVMDMKIAGGDADQFHFAAAFDPFCGDGRDCTPNYKVAPGASRWFPVACDPTRAGAVQSTLTVRSNAADSTMTMDCAAAAQASMSTLVFTPSLLDFGASYAEGYNNSLERTLTITNTATAPSIPVEFQIDDIRTGSNGVISPVEHFGTLAAGQTQTFVVVFKWTGGEQITTPLVLRSTGPIHDSISVPVFAAAGYGYLVFDDPPGPPAGISAPAVAAGETSSVTIRAHNEGIISLIVDVSTSLGIGGTAEVQSPSSVRVAPGQSVEWTITCTPDGIPPYEAGADGAIDFQYTYAAGNLDSIQLFCPVLGSSQPPASSSGRR